MRSLLRPPVCVPITFVDAELLVQVEQRKSKRMVAELKCEMTKPSGEEDIDVRVNNIGNHQNIGVHRYTDVIEVMGAARTLLQYYILAPAMKCR